MEKHFGVFTYLSRPEDSSIMGDDKFPSSHGVRNRFDGDSPVRLEEPKVHEQGDSSRRKKDRAPITVAQAVEHIGMGRFQLNILLLCGLFNAADAMEMLLLAVLAPVLKCEWLLAEYEVAFITTIVFIGSMVMAPLWGSLADHYGRRDILIIVCIWISFYGFLTAFSPTFNWVLLLRCLVGGGIAGAGQAFVLTSEYIPLKWRARLLVSYNVFWTAGSLFEICIAAIIVPNISLDSSISGWRVLVVVSSIPLAIVAVIAHRLPESARFLVTAGRHKEAQKVLEEAARVNKQPKLPGPLKPEPSSSRGNIKDLFRNGLASATLRCWVLWFTAAFAYYGMILLSAVLLNVQEKDCTSDPDIQADMAAGGSAASSTVVCSCMPPSRETYTSMLVSTLGEVLSCFLNLLTLDRLGRQITMALYLTLEGTIFLFLLPCGLSTGVTTFLIFIMRGLSSAYFVSLYIYVAEIFPTRVRALSLGSCAAASRIGAIVTPFIAQVLIEHNRTAALVIYGVILFLSAIVALSMPKPRSDGVLHV